MNALLRRRGVNDYPAINYSLGEDVRAGTKIFIGRVRTRLHDAFEDRIIRRHGLPCLKVIHTEFRSSSHAESRG